MEFVSKWVESCVFLSLFPWFESNTNALQKVSLWQPKTDSQCGEIYQWANQTLCYRVLYGDLPKSAHNTGLLFGTIVISKDFTSHPSPGGRLLYKRLARRSIYSGLRKRYFVGSIRAPFRVRMMYPDFKVEQASVRRDPYLRSSSNRYSWTSSKIIFTSIYALHMHIHIYKQFRMV